MVPKLDDEEKSYKVLVVDDSRSIQSALLQAFAGTSYEVKSVSNPLEAYQMVEDEHFQIVVSDIEMPEMNGLDLLRKIKNHNGMTAVIIMTSYTTVNNIINAFRYGAADLIFKPFDPQEVVAAADAAAVKLDRVHELIAEAMEKKKSGL